MKTTILIALTLVLLPFTGWAGTKECVDLKKSITVLTEPHYLSQQGKLVLSASLSIGSAICEIAIESAKRSAENRACERLILIDKAGEQISKANEGGIEVNWSGLYSKCVGRDRKKWEP